MGANLFGVGYLPPLLNGFLPNPRGSVVSFRATWNLPSNFGVKIPIGVTHKSYSAIWLELFCLSMTARRYSLPTFPSAYVNLG